MELINESYIKDSNKEKKRKETFIGTSDVNLLLTVKINNLNTS